MTSSLAQGRPLSDHVWSVMIVSVVWGCGAVQEGRMFCVPGSKVAVGSHGHELDRGDLDLGVQDDLDDVLDLVDNADLEGVVVVDCSPFEH